VTIESFELDPEARAYTDDEIIVKINAATEVITRAGSISAVARPIGTCEITSLHLVPSAARDNLDAMADVNRRYVNTNPAVGEYKLISIQVRKTGVKPKLEVDFDNQAVTGTQLPQKRSKKIRKKKRNH